MSHRTCCSKEYRKWMILHVYWVRKWNIRFFFANATTCPLWISWSPSRLWPKCNWLLRLGRPWGAVTWMVIYEYEIPGGALNLSSTTLPRPWSPCESSLSRENPHGRTEIRTWDLMISSQKLWPLDHEAGRILVCWDTQKNNKEHTISGISWVTKRV
jgi:hypothetical protein